MGYKIPPEIKTQLRSQEYYERALQYYLHARHAIFCYSFPVNGNLVHHAIEMLLHAGLSRKYTFLKLRVRYSKHDLVRMWGEFKVLYPDKNLDKFNKTIIKYNKWEEVRYPKKRESNLVMFSDMHKGAESKYSTLLRRKQVEYRINLEEVDEFFKSITKTIGINPEYVRVMLSKGDSMEMYKKENRHIIWDDKN